MADPMLIARHGDITCELLPALANRHGLITGATGTGKTITLQTLAENFSRIGVPVFMADVKGDLTGISQAGSLSPKLAAILFDNEPWEPGVAREVKVKSCADDKKVEVVDRDGPKNAVGQRQTVIVCEHRITPVYDDAQEEKYEAQTIDKDADGNYINEKAHEKLRFDWTITNNGTLSANTTEGNDPIGPQSYDPLSVKWREPPTLKGNTLKLWLVVRDGRGGESWETRELKLVE